MKTELSPRQVQVMRQLELGMTDKEIAERIGVKPKTVSFYVMLLRVRLRARNRVHAVALWRDHQGA